MNQSLNTPINNAPFLRTSRDFPEEVHELAKELNKSYVDIANSVNVRTIGIYAITRSTINGNSFFVSNARQQGLRQLYVFTATTDIPLGFKLSSIYGISQMYGTYVDVANNGNIYGLIPGTTVGIAGQISFYIFIDTSSTTTDVIKFIVDGTAPVLKSGMIVVEWIANV